MWDRYHGRIRGGVLRSRGRGTLPQVRSRSFVLVTVIYLISFQWLLHINEAFNLLLSITYRLQQRETMQMLRDTSNPFLLPAEKFLKLYLTLLCFAWHEKGSFKNMFTKIFGFLNLILLICKILKFLLNACDWINLYNTVCLLLPGSNSLTNNVICMYFVIRKLHDDCTFRISNWPLLN